MTDALTTDALNRAEDGLTCIATDVVLVAQSLVIRGIGALVLIA